MTEIIYYVATSLDGYIATADGSADWLSHFHAAEEDQGAVFPILLASGVPLFAPHSSQPDSLRLVAAKPFKSGIVQLTYDRTQNA